MVAGFGGALGPQELMVGVVAFGGQGVHGRTGRLLEVYYYGNAGLPATKPILV